MKGMYVSPEERSLLHSNNFSLRPLATAGYLHVWRVITVTWLPFILFVFTLTLHISAWRKDNESGMLVVHYIGMLIFLAYPVFAMLALLVGILSTALSSKVRWSACVYWMWWPTTVFSMCVVAAVAGTIVGNSLWAHNFLVYNEIHSLQVYNNIDVTRVSGERLQDAGLVTFNDTFGVDRGKSGCFKNGATYCIAPILAGGQVLPGDEVTPRSGNFDLFVAGVDCCRCPDPEFRCGDWNTQKGLGGFRVLDKERREMYRLAAADWASTYHKNTGHAIFFEWVADPADTLEDLNSRGWWIYATALITCAFGFVSWVALANALLKYLSDNQLCQPIDAPIPKSALGQMIIKHGLPQMHQHAMDTKAQQGLGLGQDNKFVVL